MYPKRAHHHSVIESRRRDVCNRCGLLCKFCTSATNPQSDSFDAKEWFRVIDHQRGNKDVACSEDKFGVSFKDLRVFAKNPTVRYLPTFANVSFALLRQIAEYLGKGNLQKVEILKGLDGLVRGGEMLLVLGRPKSGCSTLLKVLAGDTHGLVSCTKTLINYQGVLPSTIYSEFRSECTYTSELDVHFPELTVAETLSFAGEARVPRDSLSVSRREYGSYMKDCMLAMFRLSSAANTKLGNENIQGVSGGERKRVSIAEALMGLPLLKCWDNSTRGLDSATALSFVQLARSYTEARGSVTIISLYQASQSILDMFNKILLLYEGQQIFFGDMDTALSYFARLGFERPSTMTTGDFLTSLTNPIEAAILRHDQCLVVPRSADDFALLWRDSRERAAIIKEILTYERENPFNARSLEKVRNAKCFGAATGFKRQGSAYIISIYTQIELCLRRGFRRIRNNVVLPVSFVLGNFIMALIVGSIFFNLEESTKDLSRRGIAIFFAILLNAFMTGFEVLTIWSQRSIVEKQSRLGFYHPFVEAISAMLCDIPTKILTSLLFNLTLYFMINLRRTPEAFLTFWLLSFVCMMTMSMLFRCTGSMGRTFTQVMVPLGVILIALITYAGFVIPVSYMHPWLRWVAYINPIAYAFESLMVNEFHDRQFGCSNYIPYGPSYDALPQHQKICSSIGSVSGRDFVDGDQFIELSFSFHHSHLWRNLWILFALMILFCILHVWSSEYILRERPKGDVLVFPRGKYTKKYEQRITDEEAGSVHQSASSVPKLDPESPAEEFRELPTLLPHTAVFHWARLCYDVEVKGKRRRLLTEVDGWVKPGSLTALMGATGTGKTTLLNVLANRTTAGVVTGEIQVDSERREAGFQRKIGFVQQQDLHLPTATVRETLQFSALLRQPPSIPEHEKLSYVEEIVKVLEMETFSDAIVATPGDGLSTEQRRRLSIGVELAAKPELLLLLDEPTSGLDSQTAWTICSLLRKLADKGQAIMCTIHQPSSQLLQMFDQLLLIEEGGKTLYFGELGTGSGKVISYFEQQGVRPYQPHENPAEWMLDITTNGNQEIDWSEKWKSSTERTIVQRHICDIKTASRLHLSNSFRTSQYSSSLFTQFRLLTKRTFTEYWRTPSHLWAKLMFCSGASMVIGFSCYKAPSTLQGLQTQLFAIFLVCTNFSNIMQQIIPTFVVRRSLFEAREQRSKTYSWQAFILSAIVTEAAWQIVMSVFSFALFYYPVGMYAGIPGSQQSERGALMFLLFCAFFIFTSTLSHLLIAGFKDAETAVNIGQLVFYLVLIFSGVLVSESSLPRFWMFMYRVSPLTYLVAGMLAVGVGNKPISCAEIELLRLIPSPNTTCGDYLGSFIQIAGGTLVNPTSSSDCQYCPLANTNDFLKTLDIEYRHRWLYFGLLFVYIMFNIAATFTVYYLVRVPKRPKLSSGATKRE